MNCDRITTIRKPMWEDPCAIKEPGTVCILRVEYFKEMTEQDAGYIKWLRQIISITTMMQIIVVMVNSGEHIYQCSTSHISLFNC